MSKQKKSPVRSPKEIAKALKSAEQAFAGFSLIASSLSLPVEDASLDSDHYRAVEEMAIGHGAIVHVLEWILGKREDSGIQSVIIREVPEEGFSVVSVACSAFRGNLQ